MTTIDLTTVVDDVATIISGAPFPSTKSRADARVILEHLTPLIEAAAREQIGQEIEALVAETERRLETARVQQRPDRIVKYKVVAETARHAARIARGGDA